MDPTRPAGSPNFNTAPALVPKFVAKKLYELFSSTITPIATGRSTPLPQRSILLQKGTQAKAVKLIARKVLGKELYEQLVSELRSPYVATIAKKMQNSTLTPEDLKETSSREVAEAHLQAFPPEKTEALPLQSCDANVWIALRYDRAEGVIENKVNTTSERSFKELENQDLTNIYVKISDDGHISITCGVIDTTAKADAFIAALQWAKAKREEQNLPEPPIRISMHQLNSLGVGPGTLVSEKVLVTRQREMALYINSKLSPDGAPIVSHTNRCLNGFTLIRGEDAKSHHINQAGLALQMQWVFEDVRDKVPNVSTYQDAQSAVTDTNKKLQQKQEILRLTKEKYPNLKQKLDTIRAQMCELILNDLTDLGIADPTDADTYSKLEKQAFALELQIADRKALEQDIHTLEKTLVKQNKELCKALHALWKQLPETSPEKAKLHLALTVLASQTDMNKALGLAQLSSTQELACMLLFDEALHATTEINCKSGLDRTGFTRSLQTAIQMKMKTDNDLNKTLIFLLEFEKNAKQNIKEIKDFQRIIFDEVQKVALEITERSTGLKGMKWNWSSKLFFQRNPHPINWLPAEHFTLDKNGNRAPTPEAIALICGLSPKRGG